MPLSVDDRFRDRTMSFGEHLEELRLHLWRAVWGVLIAFVVMSFVGNYVVQIIARPVEQQLEPWFKRQIEVRTRQLKHDEELKAPENQRHVSVEWILTPESMAALAERLGQDPPTSAEPVKLTMSAPIGSFIEKLTEPMNEINRRWALKTLSAQEAFVIYFKAVVGAALVVASPWVFYQLYSFVAVGLYAHERRIVNLSLPFSVALFLMGVFVCYFLVFPRMLGFFLWANEWMKIEPDIRLNEWVGFSVILMLIFGVGFQLPLLMLVLDRVGILSHSWMVKQRRMAVLVLAVVSAVVTPGGDPMTMLFLAVPLYLLFELGLFLMAYFRRHNPFAASEPRLEEIEAEI